MNDPTLLARFEDRTLPEGAAQARSIERALERATPFLRARLADAVEMKRVPELRFVFDGLAPPDDEGSAR